MIKLFASVCINAPAATVWTRLAKLEDIQLSSEAVVHATCDGTIAQGVGAQRTCELVGHRIIRERWLAWDEGRSFQYEGVGLPLVKRATNRWAVIPHGTQTVLTSEAEVELKGGLVGKLLEPILRPLMQGMAPNALAGFKYLVEQGQPYQGAVAGLPRPSATC